jgi:hypothetical protein
MRLRAPILQDILGNPIDAATSAFVVGHVLLETPVERVAAFLQGAGQDLKVGGGGLFSVRERDAALECPINQQDNLGERIAVRHIVMLPDPHPRATIASAFVVQNFDSIKVPRSGLILARSGHESRAGRATRITLLTLAATYLGHAGRGHEASIFARAAYGLPAATSRPKRKPVDSGSPLPRCADHD